jgi:uncharacterized protein YecT (DUF1311 family)
VNDLLNTLSHTPLPTILVVAGILFWILAVSGSVAGKISVEPAKQRTAAIVGTWFIALGMVLLYAPDRAHHDDEAAATAKPVQPPVAQATPNPAATLANTTSAPAPAPAPVPPPASTSIQSPAPAPPPPVAARPSPGVNCTGTGTPDEIRICGSSKLSELDRQLSELYRTVSQGLDKDQRARLAREESGWVKTRGECQSDEACIASAYRSRIEQLQSLAAR